PAALEVATPTSTSEYVVCGALQALLFLAYSYATVVALRAGYNWVSAGSSAVGIYLRLIVASSSAFLVVCAVPIAAKWVLVGRWKAQQIRLWSLASVRFWVVKTLVRSFPDVRLFLVTHIYTTFLSAMCA